MGVKILDETIRDPYTFMGRCAGIAYDSDVTDPSKCYKRGKRCVADGHGRMLEFCDVYMEITGYSARVMREFMRHVGDGLTCIQRSTRYCNEDGFGFYIPLSVRSDEEKLAKYNEIMASIQNGYNDLLDMNVSKEDAANVLPLGMSTVVAIKKNARCLIDMSRVRLCNRAYVEYRMLMKEICIALANYSDEWAELVANEFKPKCDVSGYCDEHMSCGRRPKKVID